MAAYGGPTGALRTMHLIGDDGAFILSWGHRDKREMYDDAKLAGYVDGIEFDDLDIFHTLATCGPGPDPDEPDYQDYYLWQVPEGTPGAQPATVIAI